MDNRRLNPKLPNRQSRSLFSRVKSFFSPQAALAGAVKKQKMPGSYQETSNNQILCSFFQQKGGEPLTDVEYEGVLSLINKSKVSVPNTANSTIVPVSEHNDSHILSTPHTQTILKSTTIPNSFRDANTSIMSTPDYTPSYHTVNNSFANRSVKRVYQFSGLPSPYKTRIKVPSFKNEEVSDTPPTKRPKSETANVLLSVLEKDDTDTQPKKRFSNPYGSKFKKAQLTAKDINNTISFDKSKSLEEKVPESSFNFTYKEKDIDASTATADPEAGRKNGIIPSNLEKPFLSGSIDKGNPPKFPIGISQAPTEKPTLNTTKQDFAPAFSIAPNETEFQLPEVKPTPVVLDLAKVNEYKELFAF